MYSAASKLVYVGVQPFAIANNQLFLLLGREREVSSTEDERGLWSDFGGGPDRDELNDPLRGATRECYEESMGLLGNKEEIRQGIISTYCKYPNLLGDEHPHTDCSCIKTSGLSFARRVKSERQRQKDDKDGGEGIPCILMKSLEKNTYAVVFLMQISYDKNLPKQFRNVFQYGHPCFKKQNSGHCEGSWEKDDAIWIPLPSSCKDIDDIKQSLYSSIGAGGMRKEYEESFCHLCSALASKISQLESI